MGRTKPAAGAADENQDPEAVVDAATPAEGGAAADPDVDVDVDQADEPEAEAAVTLTDAAALTGTPVDGPAKRKRDVSYQDAVKAAKAVEVPFISAAMAADLEAGAEFVVDPGSGRKITREDLYRTVSRG